MLLAAEYNNLIQGETTMKQEKITTRTGISSAEELLESLTLRAIMRMPCMI